MSRDADEYRRQLEALPPEAREAWRRVEEAFEAEPAVARERAIQAAGQAALEHHGFCTSPEGPLAYELRPDGSTAFACPACGASAEYGARPARRRGPEPAVSHADVERSRRVLGAAWSERSAARFLGASRSAVRWAQGKDSRRQR